MQQKVKDITIVSLSSGMLGEDFVRHEIDIGIGRLRDYGIRVRFAKHALMGLDETAKHPEYRAEDLLDAFRSNTDMILCAVGGDDTYRLLPYLFGNGELQRAVSDKIFLGFSDTTANHFMLHKVGLPTFYGQAFLPDICELDHEMLPYTQRCFEELIQTGSISKVTPSGVWYSSREDFSPASVGTAVPCHENDGFRLLQGAPRFSGEILGGCIDTIYDFFDSGRYADSAALCQQYQLFPSTDEWKGKILLLESSEEKASPQKYRSMLTALKETGIFSVISGILVGKPADETYMDEYHALLREIVCNPTLPIVGNLSVGHALPRCIIPLGVPAVVDIKKQEITFGANL